MIDRGLYHFYVAHQKGLTSEPSAADRRPEKSRFRDRQTETNITNQINCRSIS
jgi:hypothetical protein